MTCKWSTAFHCLISQAIIYLLLWKKDRLSRYTRMVVQKSNMGHLIKIFIYKTLKLLRPYLAYFRTRAKIVTWYWNLWQLGFCLSRQSLKKNFLRWPALVYTATKIPCMYSQKRNCAVSVQFPLLHFYVSVSDLYVPRIGPHIFLLQNRQTDRENI